jgi:AraC-like DNA-binding protein
MANLLPSLLSKISNLRVVEWGESLDGLSLFLRSLENGVAPSDVFVESRIKKELLGLKEGVLLEAVDRFWTRCSFFKNEGRIYAVGPYIREPFTEIQTVEVLSKNGFSGSFLEPLRLYYGSLALGNQASIASILSMILSSLYPERIFSFELRRFGQGGEKENKENKSNALPASYEAVYRKYEMENAFLSYIEQGEPERALRIFASMTTMASDELRVYVPNSPQVAMASLRTLVRKAAERSGLSVIAIDKIVQDATLRMDKAKNYPEFFEAIRDYIYRIATAVKEHLESDKNLSPKIIQVRDFLKENYAEDVTLENVANKFLLSKDHLSRTFKKEMGMGVVDYLARLRIEEACSLLRGGDLAIADIANSVGYEDPNYFVKVFRKKKRMTPSQYRKANYQRKA